MKRRLLINMSIFLFLMLTVFTASLSIGKIEKTIALEESDQWVTYTDPRFDITLAYPANWELRPPTDRPDALGSRIVLSESSSFLSETQVPRKIEIGLHLVEYSPSQSLATWSQLYDTYNGVLDSRRLLLLRDRETVHNNRTVFSREAISPLTPYTYFHIPHGRTVWYVWMNSTEPEYKAILEQVVLSMKFGSRTPTTLKEAYGSDFEPMPLQPKPMNRAGGLPNVWGDMFPPNTASIANDYITPVAVTDDISCGETNAPMCPGGTHGPQHNGAEHAIDISVGIGTDVRNSAVSTLYSANWSNDGYGNHVIMYDSQNNYLAYYAHLDWFFVVGGFPIQQGAQIGDSGDSGAGNAHLHFHVQTLGGSPEDLNGMPGLSLDADYPNCGESESACDDGFECDCGDIN